MVSASVSATLSPSATALSPVGQPSAESSKVAGGAPKQSGKPGGSGAALSMEQQAAVTRLAATDRHVRAHEQAHLAAAGPFALSGASYTMATGPDGKQYAVGGEVSLDISPVSGDPQATIQKAQVIEAAANAPADPSAQDKAVAAEAAAIRQAAQQELVNERRPEGASSFVQSAYGRKADGAGGQLLSLIL